MEILKKVVRFLAIVTTVIAMTAGILIVGSRILGYPPYIILSGSMEPDIPTGSLVFINTHERSPQEGDVVAYRLPDDVMVVHRVVAYDEDQDLYTMKGDRNDLPDASQISNEDIVGSYMLCVPYMGYVMQKFEYPAIHLGAGFYLSGPVLLLVSAVLILNIADYLLHADLDSTESKISKKESKEEKNYE